MKISVEATQRSRNYGRNGLARIRDLVIVTIDGVAFETECTGPDTARDLAVKTAKALGIAYKKG